MSSLQITRCKSGEEAVRDKYLYRFSARNDNIKYFLGWVVVQCSRDHYAIYDVTTVSSLDIFFIH